MNSSCIIITNSIESLPVLAIIGSILKKLLPKWVFGQVLLNVIHVLLCYQVTIVSKVRSYLRHEVYKSIKTIRSVILNQISHQCN